MIKPFTRDPKRTSHLERSFITQRTGMAFLAAMFPVAFLASSFLFGRTEFQTSISAYYWTLDTERNLFVGVLSAIAVFFLLYKGYNWTEDRILDLAGLSAAGVAFFPMDQSGNDCNPSGVSAHGVFAVILFACIFYVCIFMSEHTLQEILESEKQTMFRRVYRWCSGVMVGSIAFAVLSWLLLPEDVLRVLCEYSVIFWFEALGIWAFSVFWYVKTRELDASLSWVPFQKKR